jgi:hypothetical protein
VELYEQEQAQRLTPQERVRIFNQERQAQGRTPQERRAIFFAEQQAAQQQPRQRQEDLLTRFRRNVGIAAEQGYQGLKDKLAALSEIGGGIVTGDFRPAIEAAQLVGQGAQRLATSSW